MQELVHQVHVEEDINKYIVNLVRKTRSHPHVVLGGSPRASLCLYRAAQAWALCNERTYVVPDDVLMMAGPVLEHRLVLGQEARLRNVTADKVIEDAKKNTKIPM
jgi:MoxR-like ATPase